MNEDEVLLRILEGVLDTRKRMVRVEAKVDGLVADLASFRAVVKEYLEQIDHDILEGRHDADRRAQAERRRSLWADLVDP